ncbi:MAG: GlcNAc-PI de-N-acetylase [Epulopiscium sp. Nele67-Bin005]|nr:MAG: GlcNAc-PI de-N-acetylase [Epulopiscium sp. Nele67-Bin005]
MKTIMAIGAHIGDMELTAGGILATAALNSDKIIIVSVTAGERGNPQNTTVEQYKTQKILEASNFAKALKATSVILGYKDGEIPNNDIIRWEICDLIRKYKPDTIITHWRKSIHKDHEVTYNVVKDAQFFAGLASIERQYPPHFAKGPYYAENWEDGMDFEKYVYIKISEEGFNLWNKIIDYHWFVNNSECYPYKKYYSQLKSIRGIEARALYAEVFNLEEHHKRVVKDEI